MDALTALTTIYSVCKFMQECNEVPPGNPPLPATPFRNCSGRS